MAAMAAMLVACEGQGPAVDGGYLCEGAIEFPDAALDAAVRLAALGPEASEEEVLDYPTLLGVTGLDLSGLAVGDLRGMECAQGLTILRMADNAVEDVTPLSGLSRLRAVDVSGNPLGSLAGLEGLEHLEELSAREVGLGTVEGIAQRHPELKILDVADNAIEDLGPLEALTGLERLDASGNDLIGLPWPAGRGCALRYLTASQNAITSLDGAGRWALGLQADRNNIIVDVVATLAVCLSFTSTATRSALDALRGP